MSTNYPVFNCKNGDDVIRAVKDYNVSFVQFWFVDILGNLKSFQVTPDELEAAFEEGMGFDGSSILGFTRIEESDMIAFPDASSFQICSWRPMDRPVARMFCDIRTPDGNPYEGDPRYVLRRLVDKAAQKGYTYYVGPELEFFLFADSTCPRPLDSGGYFDAPPLDLGNEVRRDIIFALQKMGIDVEYSHHEVAPSQHEIDLRYNEALKMADIAMTYKVVVKEIARKHGVYATFMPKPIFGENGSGMHVHQSLFKNGKNAFFDANDPHHLSAEARHYIAGLLTHASEITCITNQWVNSYKRLVPGYEAPVYIAWAQRNRSSLIRVPMYKPGKEAATRIELRNPDPACNPYLAFAAMLGAGLEGIEKGYEVPRAVEENIFAMEAEDLSAKGIDSLPGSLYEAAVALRDSALMKEVLGEHTHQNLVGNKLIEWDAYRTHVSEFELKRYLPVL
ncbi:glutamine synthetase, type I [Oleidesulfovibrio alaskensis G20]|jgi:glutamine synthetase|uniref:Glutamine synthetase, type I n=1 Tax=Oleidesulfovibrio alaskensis (strain ATCC BAA-1058 / DSM 17464 / G20) TaxID=207559 RepID=Q317J1_OLEA2|nr:glutamine synthetase family protein [Oleidesulfovibrio alaskensis]ABB36905.1 glutamine synthetase, type I [Oleidesulfovibrio alaskensis G20]MBG0774176.1 glutamine synthetase [Oleidesulfovibrio alaskensis]MBL3583612.1 glutamine synthetase [Oleidesulfovibrio alaskensis]